MILVLSSLQFNSSINVPLNNEMKLTEFIASIKLKLSTWKLSKMYFGRETLQSNDDFCWEFNFVTLNTILLKSTTYLLFLSYIFCCSGLTIFCYHLLALNPTLQTSMFLLTSSYNTSTFLHLYILTFVISSANMEKIFKLLYK